MRREDSRAHSCFDFIDYGLGGDNSLFKSMEVPGCPELIESDIEKNVGKSFRGARPAVLREAMSEKNLRETKG